MSNSTLTITDPEVRRKVTERLTAAQKASKIPGKDASPEQKKDVAFLNQIKDQFKQPDTRNSPIRRETSYRGTPPEAPYISDEDPEIVDDPLSINLDEEDEPKKPKGEDNIPLTDEEDEDEEEVVLAPKKEARQPQTTKSGPNPDRRRIKDAEKQLAASNKESAKLERDTLRQMQQQQADMFNKLLGSQQVFQMQQQNTSDLSMADKIIGDLSYQKNVARQQNNVDLVEDIVSRLMQAQNIKRNLLNEQKQINEHATTLLQQPKQPEVNPGVQNAVQKIMVWAEDKPFNVREVNGDYIPQDRSSKKAVGEIKTLVQEGWDINDPEFFEELDDRLHEKLPSWYEEEDDQDEEIVPKTTVRKNKPTVMGGGSESAGNDKSMPAKININDIRDRGIRQMIRNIRDKQGEKAAAAFIKQHLFKGGN